MDRIKDNDIREVLRRKEARRLHPNIPADFCDKVMAEIESQPSLVIRWRWVAVIASLLLLVGIGVTLMISHEPKSIAMTEPKTQEKRNDVSKVTEEARPSPEKQDAIVIAEADKIGEAFSVTKVNTKKKKEQKTRTTLVVSENKIITSAAVDLMDVVQESIAPADEAFQCYNANIENAVEDTMRYAPCKVDEFIAKLADSYNVSPVALKCVENKDSSVVAKAYVFPDNERVNLFGRLLQVACCYDDATPGYLLNFSHRQFFFTLEDCRKGLKYLWIAERIGGNRILLYSTRSTNETTIPSTCFRKYREQLTNTNITL